MKNIYSATTFQATEISGWGGYPRYTARVVKPRSRCDFKESLIQADPLIPRGMGRSYGDSANAPNVIESTYWDHLIAFDEQTGRLKVEAGVCLRDILTITIRHGWFLPVTPGTSFVTVGGAIASDVHGKNHHHAGTFGQYVLSMEILLGSGEIVKTSSTELSDLFHATCGGMGLTGVILTADLQLIRISSAFIQQRTIKANSLEEACEVFETNQESTYSVAWIDCLSRGKNLGRSVLVFGEHADYGGYDLVMRDPIQIQIHTPATLLNSLTMRLFNQAYWLKAREIKNKTMPLVSYFYPLDAIGGWNKLYGKAGFIQYQFVIPKSHGASGLRLILSRIAQTGLSSFLAVLKRLGPTNQNILSFPMDGYTLALDFKMTSDTIPALHTLDDLVVGMGGRIYLTKDAVMREHSFKISYPQWHQFEEVRYRFGAAGKFASTQSKRLGLA